MRVPDFFLIGVPRAATSSLYDALGRHPGIHVGAVKEACFTCPDIDPHTRHRTPTRFYADRAEYLTNFHGATDDQLIGEGCTYNVYSPAAPALIRGLNPDARLLIQLRDPVEQMYSNHGHKVLMGDLGADFARVVVEQAAARGGRTTQPLNMADYDLVDKATVGPGLDRFVDEFGRDRIHVSLYDDFAADAPAVVRSVLEFLGVSTTEAPRPDISVPHREARWGRLNRTMASPAVIGRAKRLTPSRLHPIARSVAATVFRRNRRRALRPQMPADVRDRLRAVFRSEVQLLSELVGRDLAAIWWSR
ncbi:MAG TPA: sulfotransferase [Candidatus Limnocylindria bacterium]|nr:sulfotransferase [Candidatus Limnocylindria bacterium]